MTNRPPRPDTGNSLNYARVLAALTVFYYHIGLPLKLPLSSLGEYAVTTFLLLAIVSAVAFSLPKQSVFRPGTYLATRLWRLLPLYLCVNIFLYAVSFVVPSKLGRPFTVVELVLSCLGLSQYLGGRFLSMLFWFVPFIIQVYVLIAFGGRFVERLRRWEWLPVAFALYWLEILAVGAWDARPDEFIRDWSPLFRPAETLLGAQGGLWLTGRLSNAEFAGRVGLYAALAGVLSLGAAWGGDMAYNYTLPLAGLLVTLVIVGGGVLLALVLPAGVDALGRRLARATYPFYLIHGIAIFWIFRRFGPAPAAWLAYLALCGATALALDAVFSPRRRVVAS